MNFCAQNINIRVNHNLDFYFFMTNLVYCVNIRAFYEEADIYNAFETNTSTRQIQFEVSYKHI